MKTFLHLGPSQVVPARELHQPLQGKNAQHRIAFGVQLWPPDRYGADARNDGYDAATYAGFNGQTDAVGQVASGVVSPAGQEQGVDAAGGISVEELLARVCLLVDILPVIR